MTEKQRRKAAIAKLVSGSSQGHVHRPDNVMIWVDGNGHGYGTDNLNGLIYLAEHEIEQQIREARDQVNFFAKKERRGGKLYWYQWLPPTQSWKYIGVVGKGEDPRTPYRKRLSELEQHLENKKALMKSCVIKKLGRHLLIDIAAFREHVDKKLPGNIIKLEDVIS